MRPQIWLLAVVFYAGSFLSAQPAQAPHAAVQVRVDTSRLARIDRALQVYVDENRVAGAVALVLQDGQSIYERAVGWSDKEAGRRSFNEPKK